MFLRAWRGLAAIRGARAVLDVAVPDRVQRSPAAAVAPPAAARPARSGSRRSDRLAAGVAAPGSGGPDARSRVRADARARPGAVARRLARGRRPAGHRGAFDARSSRDRRRRRRRRSRAAFTAAGCSCAPSSSRTWSSRRADEPFVEALPERGRADRATVLLEVALVVVLGVVERRRGDDLGHDRPSQGCLAARHARRLPAAPARHRGRRSPSGTGCRCPSPAGWGWSGRGSTRTSQQLVVADERRVKPDLHRLGVAGGVRADLLIGRVDGAPTGVADARLTTPSISRNEASTPQKQPAANVARSKPSSSVPAPIDSRTASGELPVMFSNCVPFRFSLRLHRPGARRKRFRSACGNEAPACRPERGVTQAANAGQS